MTTMTEPRVWEFDLPIPMDMLSANDRRGRWGNASAIATWRGTAYTVALQEKLPKHLRRARIDIVVWPAHEKDTRNLEPLCKAIVDGFGPPFLRKPNAKTGYKGASAPGYELIPNDDRKHLDGHHLHVLDPQPPRGRVLVVITDLSDVPEGRTWTPELPTSTGRRIRVKRACNGCGARLGDIHDAEIEAVMGAEPLPDVRGECPNCRTDSHCHVTRADGDEPCLLGAHEGDVHEDPDGTEYRTVALTEEGGRRG
jgi:hypothetical protein